jgi:nucleoside-diphosphate-sugar epimerase
MDSKNTVLVLGATGGIGGEVARQLKDGGWHVRALQRRGAQPIERRNGITWFRGDALNAQDVRTAANGCSVIVHAVNPPGYRHWSELVLPMLDNSIAVATALRATLMLPGTVYNFAPDAFPVLSEDSPQHPVTRKGAIRVEMERRLLAASNDGARVVIVRAAISSVPRPGIIGFPKASSNRASPSRR